MNCRLCYKGKLDRGRHIVRPTVATQKSPAAETFALVVQRRRGSYHNFSKYRHFPAMWLAIHGHPTERLKAHIMGVSVISVMSEGKASELEC